MSRTARTRPPTTKDYLAEAAWPPFVRAGDLERALAVSHDTAYTIMHRAGAIVLGPKCLRLPRERLIAYLRARDRMEHGAAMKRVENARRAAEIGPTYAEAEGEDHPRYESAPCIPEWLARLEAHIFAGLAPEDAHTWPKRFAAAIALGAYLKPVRKQFLAWLMRGNLDRVQTLDIDETLKAQVADAISGVLGLRGGTWGAVTESAREAARMALPLSSPDAVAAWMAAQSAAEAARDVAWSVEFAAKWSAKMVSPESAAYRAQADALITLLAEARP